MTVQSWWDSISAGAGDYGTCMYVGVIPIANSPFHCFWGMGSHFRVQSQEDADIDVIGYKCRTSNFVVGAYEVSLTFKA